jgi:hypothetical protein
MTIDRILTQQQMFWSLTIRNAEEKPTVLGYSCEPTAMF